MKNNNKHSCKFFLVFFLFITYLLDMSISLVKKLFT